MSYTHRDGLLERQVRADDGRVYPDNHQHVSNTLATRQQHISNTLAAH
jgi:hypothetical protein